MKMRVAQKLAATEDVACLVLKPEDGRELPGWAPGAHIDIRVGDFVRQYSLCSNPEQRQAWRLGVLAQPAGRGGSVAVSGVLEGDVVEVSEPRNNFAFVEAPRYLFLAGGIGITPILPMVQAAEQAGAEWRLVYGGRSREGMAFVEELAAYGDRVTLVPEDERGLIDLAGTLAWCDDATQVYSCGPEPMLAALEAAMENGVPGVLHLERFTPKELEGDAVDEPFEVEFVASGITRTIPADRSILDVAMEEGLDVFSSCEQGTCGTCVTAILSGRADHRDSLLTKAERERHEAMCICVSRAEPNSGPLCLDL
jgi:ferredoxin-NADP reductase